MPNLLDKFSSQFFTYVEQLNVLISQLPQSTEENTGNVTNAMAKEILLWSNVEFIQLRMDKNISNRFKKEKKNTNVTKEKFQVNG